MGGVVIIGATNRDDVLDPALVREGRFDLRITVPNPDLAAREDILRNHVRTRVLEDDVDLRSVARGTVGFSGAALAALVNEAALRTVRRGGHAVSNDDLEGARDAKLLGGDRRELVIDPEEMRVIRCHEAGHALLACTLPGCDPVHKATVTPRGRSLGHVAAVPLRDRLLVRRSVALDQVAMLLGGRAAEEAVFGADLVTSGAMSDFGEVTRIVRDMVARYGMGSTMVSRVDESNAFSPRLVSERSKEAVDHEVERIVSEQYARALAVVRDDREALDAIVAAFVDCETLTGDRIRCIVRDARASLEEAAEADPA